MTMQLELDDIQGTVLRNRPMPYYGAYVLLSIDIAEAARTLLKNLIHRAFALREGDLEHAVAG
jgi:hypothetical protein